MIGRSLWRKGEGRLLGVLGVFLLALSCWPAAPPPSSGRTVFLGVGLSDEQVVVLSANLAAIPRAVLLLDLPEQRPLLRRFLHLYQPEAVVPIGAEDNIPQLRHDLGGWVQPLCPWTQGPPLSLWAGLFPQATEVVVSAAAPRELVLHAACLAGTIGAPFCIVHHEEDAKVLRRQLAAWKSQRVYLAGQEAADCLLPVAGQSVHFLPDAAAVATYQLERLRQQGIITTLVVANPTDAPAGRLGLSSLVPWIACRRQAGLLLTRQGAAALSRQLHTLLRQPELRKVDHLLLVGDLRALPPERRPNPLPGADAYIDIEPPVPEAGEPFSLAVGRLFHRQAGLVLLQLARQELLALAPFRPRQALLVSNPDGGLPLLETISRTTARELANAGYQTTALFASQCQASRVRQLLPQADLFLWEGHFGTLTSYGLVHWPEPLPPALVFLQSCLALNETVAEPLLRRGAVALIGSPARTYSATGGALTLAYFDALLYDDQTIGGALRQAKNFLLAYARLKEQRLGKAARLTGANVRSAWAFTLWGDPTLRLPRPVPRPGGENPAPDSAGGRFPPSAPALPPVRAQVRGRQITITLPAQRYLPSKAGRYEAVIWPNGRLAGLVRSGDDAEASRVLVPLVFAELALSGSGTPRLHSRLPADSWVFLWDRRRRHGYLLVRPRSSDRQRLSFEVEWEDAPLPARAAASSSVPADSTPVPLESEVPAQEE
jgi:hypothetical protein